MQIEKVKLKGYRNFFDATINLDSKTLMIGANDSGKTNFAFALRILLDKSLSESEIEPSESDFHIRKDGTQCDELSIEIHFKETNEDAVIAVLKGNVSEDRKTIFRYEAIRKNLDYSLKVGVDEGSLNVVNSRFYLKYLNLKYVKSNRDLEKFVSFEKRHLLKLSQELRSEEQIESDQKQLEIIETNLAAINDQVGKLNYVADATKAVNEELLKLSHDLTSYSVHLDSGSIQTQQFIDNLKLGASTAGSKISLGGDGRNNQILMALWKAKSQREFDPESEVVFYCVEEPEAHLHPHQQRKLADYLIKDLPGQTIITSHSPQITARYSPQSIVHIVTSSKGSYAASGGCSDCIANEWDNLGYRMSILPAEAFFSKCVLLVEGPSELLFYNEMAKKIGIDLDYYNISILNVEGIQFKVYTKILDAMEIPWVARTDNDISSIEVQGEKLKHLAGINRCQSLAGQPSYPHLPLNTDHQTVYKSGLWDAVSKVVNEYGVYLAKVDLETDIADEFSSQLLAYTSEETLEAAIDFLQKKKAIRMREFLAHDPTLFTTVKPGLLAQPLFHCVKMVKEGV
ncbi:AAA family ATPase [Pseudomonas sp. TNT2022 ID1044]|uniref:ATP-dependent nuclease n=1 Tax=Pseudomonas sp. TNT2022 ID1044 TaxID=2942636 RepID=UPI00235FFC63|nr:AAA family ATPase [Pseudomonas sp. TNT2022 ID1044]MDD0995867.1 AAA family ATPase [Pseudomonas sp. TNT2022 ID1044]